MASSLVSIPKVSYRSDRGEYFITVPKRLSKTGKRYPVYGKSEEEVITNYKTEVALFNGGIAVGTKNGIPTLKDMISYTMINYIYNSIAETSYRRYESACEKHIFKNDIAKMPINEITSIHLTQFFRSQPISTLCRSTLNIIGIIMRKTFLRTKELKYRNDNPMEFVEVNYGKCKKPKKQKQLLTVSELKKIELSIFHLSQLFPQFRYTSIFMVMAYTGLRIGEAMALKKTDIDKVNRKIIVNKQMAYISERDKNLHRKKTVQVECEPKTDNSFREVNLTKQAEYWLDFMMSLNEKFDRYDSEYIFVNKSNKIPSKHNVDYIWHKILDECGIETCTPHKLRKTFITNLLNGGLDLPNVAAMAGHKDKTLTLNTYYQAISNTETDKIVIRNMENIFDNTPIDFDNKDNTLTTLLSLENIG